MKNGDRESRSEGVKEATRHTVVRRIKEVLRHTVVRRVIEYDFMNGAGGKAVQMACRAEKECAVEDHRRHP